MKGFITVEKTNNKLKILIADDSPTIIRILTDILQKNNYEVISAENGIEAIKKVYEFTPDFVILDILMPHLTGFQVCRLIKSNEVLKNIPVILLTRLKEQPQKFHGVKAGADIYIEKPFKENQIIEALNSLLPQVKSEKKEKKKIELIEILSELSIALENRYLELSIIEELGELIKTISDFETAIKELFELLKRIFDYDLLGILTISNLKGCVAYIDTKITILGEDINNFVSALIESLYENTQIRLSPYEIITKKIIERQHTDNIKLVKSKILPLKYHGTVIGIIGMATSKVLGDKVSERLFNLIIGHISTFLSQAMKFENLELISRIRATKLETVYELGRMLRSQTNISELLDIIAEVISKVMDSEKCSILLVDKDTKSFFIKAAKGISPQLKNMQRIEITENSISDWVIKHKEPLLIEDIYKDSRFKPSKNRSYKTRSLVCAPIVIKNKVAGIINVTGKKADTVYTREDLDLLVLLSGLVTMLIENAQLYAQMKYVLINIDKKSSEVEFLLGILKALSKSMDFQSILYVVLSKFMQFLSANACAFLEHSTISQKLIIEASKGKINPDSLELLNQELNNFDFQKNCIFCKQNPIHNMNLYVFPLITSNYKGYLYIETETEIGKDTQYLINNVLALLCLFKNKNRLFSLAIYDDKTGLYNKHYLNLRLKEKIEEAQRLKKTFCILKVSIVNFNDLLRTDSEIEIIVMFKKAGKVIKDFFRISDFVAFVNTGFIAILEDTCINKIKDSLFSLNLQLNSIDFALSTKPVFEITHYDINEKFIKDKTGFLKNLLEN